MAVGIYIFLLLNHCLSPRVTGDMDVTHIAQNPNSRYARLVASDEKAPERCAKYGIKNQDSPRSGWKQFSCSKLSYFFYGSLGPFTVYFPACGGFTKRVACFLLLLC
jgi:hypothetical protein